LFLFLLVRIPGLGKDIANTDAYRWHYRSQNFLGAVKSGDFKSTYQHYQPGVTLMWLNAFVKQLSFSFQYHLLGVNHPKTLENADFFPVIHGFSKLSILLVLAVVLFYQVSIIKDLFGRSTAIWFGLLISLEPYMVGIDRWVHLTSFEAYFLFLSLLLLLLWKKNGKKQNLILSGVFLVLSILSKVTAILTIPIFIYVIFIKKGNILKNILLFLVTCITFTFVIFPALWVAPVYVIDNIFKAITGAVGSNFSRNNFGTIIGLFFYSIQFLFKSSPTLLVGVVGFLIAIKKYIKDINIKVVLTYLLFYYLFLTLSGKKIDRYVVAMFPGLILLASVFISDQSIKIRKVGVLVTFIFYIVISSVFYPVYSAYYSPLLGGTRAALKYGLYDNSGEYFAQAALYLNKKGRDVSVFVPNGEASFFHFYKGKKSLEVNDSTDYVVTSYNFDRQTINNYGCQKLESSFGGDLGVVFIYLCH